MQHLGISTNSRERGGGNPFYKKKIANKDIYSLSCLFTIAQVCPQKSGWCQSKAGGLYCCERRLFPSQVSVNLTLRHLHRHPMGVWLPLSSPLLSSWKILLHPSFGPPTAGTDPSSLAKRGVFYRKQCSLQIKRPDASLSAARYNSKKTKNRAQRY